MSYKATNWAYELPVKGAPKNVLVALADMADESNQCYPGQKRIAEMIGRSPKTVERALKWLEAQGLISRVHRHGVGGYRTSDRYQLHVDVVTLDLTDTTPTRQIAYKAERLQGNLSHLTDTVSSPNRQGDGAEENHQYEPPIEPSVVPRKRGTRIPDPFVVNREMREWAANRVPGVDVNSSTEKFVNYWRAKTRDATKLDWLATWHNWLISDFERLQQRAAKPTPEQRARTTLALASDLLNDPKELTA